MAEGAEQRLSRRRLIGTAAAGAAAGALPGLGMAEGRRRRHGRHADVVVVGAGFAGLTAALRLAHKGKSVIVLEARDRVGGRAVNKRLAGGGISERGATFAGPTQDHILALAKRMGVSKFPTYNTGDNVYIRDGQKLTYSDSGPTGTAPPDPILLPDLTLAVTQLDNMSTSVPVKAPWKAASASDWDQQTLDTWVRANTANPDFRKLVAAATRPIFGAEARELSLLFVLFYIAASGNEQNPGTFERNFNTRDGAQMFRFHGGAQRITAKMAKRLAGRIVLGSPVRRISQSGHGVIVESDRVRVHAKQAIVAIPPTLAGRIDYSPLLPFGRDQLTQRLPQGTLTKVTAVYDRPFWRDQGLTGTSVCTDGFVQATFDDSAPDGRPGVVFGFVGGDSARRFNALSRPKRRAAVLAQFADFFGPKAKKPRQYFESNWSKQQWSRGCPVAIPGPGVLLAYGHALRKPVRRIHWAGTETSTYWNGYMDGAVRSGQRAAREVLARL